MVGGTGLEPVTSCMSSDLRARIRHVRTVLGAETGLSARLF